MKCRICGNTEANTAYEVREMMFGTQDRFGYFQCSNCLCLQIESVPENLAGYYPADYYSYIPHTETNSFRRFLLFLRNRYAVWGKGGVPGKVLYERHASTAHRSLYPLKLKRDARILDVGCGTGSFLLSLKNLGFDHLLGIDPFNEKDIDYGNGLEIRCIGLDEATGNWDVIMFHHSFEHVPDPGETLRHVAGRLAPGGCCVIRIPTVSSFAWREYGVHWVQLDAPRHLFLHSTESMKRLAGQAGLQVVDRICDSTAMQFLGSERYRRGVPLQPRNADGAVDNRQLFSKREIRDYTRQTRGLNAAGEGDQAIFYLRKHGG